MAIETKKFLDYAGTTHLWKKITTELDKKADTSNLSTVATSGAAVDVAITDAGNYFTGSTVEAALQEVGLSLTTAGAVTITPSDGAADSEVLKAYTFSQNGSTIGTINIPKDLVATSGEIVNTDGTTTGTFLKLVIANSDPIYINVADLVEYNGVADSDEIAFTDANHQISGTIKAGSIAKTKLAKAVQDSLTLADSALQAADITEGSVNGAVSVKGSSVAVHGLGSAAYTDSGAYATAAQGALAASALQEADISDGTANGKITVGTKQVSVYGLGSAAYTEASAYATAAQGLKADSALQDANVIALTTEEINAAIAAAANAT